MGSIIKLPSDIIAYMPVYSFKASKSAFDDVPDLSGTSAEDMPAVQEFMSVFYSFQEMLNSYSSLISYDGDRMKKIIETFVEADRG